MAGESPTGRDTEAGPWLFLPFGVAPAVVIGYVMIAVADDLSRAGVPLGSVSFLVTAAFVPATLVFLWAPLVDVFGRRQRWVLAGIALLCIAVAGLALAPRSASALPLLGSLSALAGIVYSLASAAQKGLAVSLFTPAGRRAWYDASFARFLSHSTAEVVGQLFLNSHAPPEPEQRDAWTAEVELLKQLLRDRSGHLLLEFNIPRMGLRADAVLLLPGCVVLLEFKVGEKLVTTAARSQVWEYALDTKNFHEPSHALPIVPVLVPTRWQTNELPPRQFASDGVCEPIAVSLKLLPQLLDELQREFPAGLDAGGWVAGRYKPTPTIIEAGG